MASRRDIREAFYTELESAVPTSGNKGHISADNIQQEMPEGDEDIPALVHDDDYRPIPMNRGSDAPTRVVTDNSGTVTNEVFGTMHEAVFALSFVFINEDEKESAYEAVRTYFEKFETSAKTWPPTGIHSSVEWVRVEEATSEDNEDANPKRFIDGLRIRIAFQREYFNPDQTSTGDPISTVDGALDADNDGTTDTTFTTT